MESHQGLTGPQRGSDHATGDDSGEAAGEGRGGAYAGDGASGRGCFVRQAITTRYAGPTNSKGSRILVRSGGGLKMTVPWNYALDIAANHAVAAETMARRQGWAGDWHGGSTPDGYAFVVAVPGYTAPCFEVRPLGDDAPSYPHVKVTA